MLTILKRRAGRDGREVLEGAERRLGELPSCRGAPPTIGEGKGAGQWGGAARHRAGGGASERDGEERAVVPASPARSAATADVSWLACVSPLLFLKLNKNFSLYSNEPLVLYKKTDKTFLQKYILPNV